MPENLPERFEPRTRRRVHESTHAWRPLAVCAAALLVLAVALAWQTGALRGL